jgi:S1-C subfamily serine protease
MSNQRPPGDATDRRDGGVGAVARHALRAGAIVALIVCAPGCSLNTGTAQREVAVLPGLTAEDAGQGGGIVVTSIQSGGAAAAAGIVVGDRITAFDGLPVATMRAARAYAIAAPQRTIDIDLVHNHALRTIRISLAETPKDVAQNSGGRG